MGTYDGMEFQELVEYFYQTKVSSLINKNNVGSYRDGDLTDFKNKSGQQLEKINTNFQKLLKDFALEIIIESNFKPKRWNILTVQ